jgi:hypothetical protein
VSANHYRYLRVSAFSEWSRAGLIRRGGILVPDVVNLPKPEIAYGRIPPRMSVDIFYKTPEVPTPTSCKRLNYNDGYVTCGVKKALTLSTSRHTLTSLSYGQVEIPSIAGYRYGDRNFTVLNGGCSARSSSEAPRNNIPSLQIHFSRA